MSASALCSLFALSMGSASGGPFRAFSESDITNTAMDGGLKVELSDYKGFDFAENDGYWHSSDPDEEYWDYSMPVIYMNSSDDISIHSQSTGGLEICRDCGTVSPFANTGDMNVDDVDGQLNIKAGGMIESRSMHNSVVVTGDAGIDAGEDLFFIAAGPAYITGTEAVGIGSASTVFSAVDANGPNQSSIELAVTSTAPWKFDSPDGSGHIVLSANSGLNLKVQDGAGIEMASDDSDVNMNLYANEFVFHDGPVVAETVVPPIVQFLPMNIPDNPENEMMFLTSWGELLIYVNDAWNGVQMFPFD